MGEVMDEMTVELQQKEDRLQALTLSGGSLTDGNEGVLQELRAVRLTLQQKDHEITLLKSMVGQAESGASEQSHMQIQMLEQTIASKTGEVNQLQHVRCNIVLPLPCSNIFI
jgi:hypothetical protein